MRRTDPCAPRSRPGSSSFEERDRLRAAHRPRRESGCPDSGSRRPLRWRTRAPRLQVRDAPPTRTNLPDLVLVPAGVHHQRAADRGRDSRGELEPGKPARAARLATAGSEAPAPGADSRPVDQSDRVEDPAHPERPALARPRRRRAGSSRCPARATAIPRTRGPAQPPGAGPRGPPGSASSSAGPPMRQVVYGRQGLLGEQLARETRFASDFEARRAGHPSSGARVSSSPNRARSYPRSRCAP